MLQGTMQHFADHGAEPQRAEKALKTGASQEFVGNMFANEVIGIIVSHASDYTRLAHRFFTLTPQAREAAVKRLRAWSKDVRDGVAELHNMDNKSAAKLANSATVRASQLSTIGKAIDAGMDYTVLAGEWKCPDPENLSFIAIYKTATGFVKGKAGRKADGIVVKLGKWIEAQSEIDDEEAMAKIIALYNTLAGKGKGNLPDALM